MSEKRILVLGHAGQLGKELMRTRPPAGVVVLGVDRDEIDIAQPEQVRQVIGDSRCHLAINCAAYTAVDRAETDVATVTAINVHGAAAVAEACDQAGAPLIHISTEYIFDGRKPGPYIEDDPPSPINAYGRSKAEAELQVRRLARRHVILRTSWLFAAHSHNFVRTILRLAREQDSLRVVDDQIGCPTPASDLTHAIFAMAAALLAGKEDGFGTFHYCGQGPITWYGFAKTILDLARPHTGLNPSIRPVTHLEYPTPACRPANSVLDCAKLGMVYGLAQKPWGPALADAINEMHQTMRDKR